MRGLLCRWAYVVARLHVGLPGARGLTVIARYTSPAPQLFVRSSSAQWLTRMLDFLLLDLYGGNGAL